MAANMYRVGDYVFFETSSTAPFQIRRIEELVKTANGNVEAKVMCYYRRRDLSLEKPLVGALEEEQEREAEQLTEKERHQLRHRELFLSRQVETLPATHIRGKCSVTLLNETESLLSYLNKEDAFFYSLVYDPQQKSLLADRARSAAVLETLVYIPSHGLSDRQLDQFLIVCRSVGTFARALDCSSSVKQPSLHMSAAAASRDVTLLHAMELLHRTGYDLARAVAALVPPGGPVLCRDEMEEWSASEANLFEEALEKYGKDFADIRQDFLPWKSLKNIVEYYYMWKTTDRYVQQKRVKAVEAESKLKQVYIPNYNNKATGVLGGPEGATAGGPALRELLHHELCPVVRVGTCAHAVPSLPVLLDLLEEVWWPQVSNQTGVCGCAGLGTAACGNGVAQTASVHRDWLRKGVQVEGPPGTPLCHSPRPSTACRQPAARGQDTCRLLLVHHGTDAHGATAGRPRGTTAPARSS
ncbi:hypothetical protein MTO96_014657 [Rhipicephalus appendiculatus]